MEGPPEGPPRLQDPRAIVTPDAFSVHPTLLGSALATPGRRLAAMAVDLLVIGVLAVVTRSFAMILGIVVAALLVRAGFRRVPVRRSVFDRAMRFSVGCLGVFVGLITFVLWGALGPSFGGSGADRPPGAPGSEVVLTGPRGLGALLSGMSGGVAFARADDAASAEAAAREIVRVGREAGLGAPEVRAILVDLVPADAAWTPDAEAIIARALADDALVPDSPRALPDEEALDPVPAVRDSVTRLLARIEAMDAVARAREARLEAAEHALEERTSGGFVGALRNVVEELGFGFGWATLYMTITLSGWKGRTLGKRLLGIRVVRLDGGPITWWTAFERAGGYAAGFATGLLGFAQIYWDANRQAIHDRIVGTVVLRDGVPRVIDWESTT